MSRLHIPSPPTRPSVRSTYSVEDLILECVSEAGSDFLPEVVTGRSSSFERERRESCLVAVSLNVVGDLALAGVCLQCFSPPRSITSQLSAATSPCHVWSCSA